MPSVNEKLLDADTSHQIDLLQYANGVVQKMLALLNRVDSDLFRQLSDALERLPADSFTVERLEQLLFSVRALNLQAYQAIGRELSDELRGFVQYEAGYQDPENELAAVEEEGPPLGTLTDPAVDPAADPNIDPLTGQPRKPDPAVV